ncbi:MAG: type I secretion system permease/ATPase [Phyllobacteriaceae bacterium]|nr:type I secretion system permease/ATPase [Phyllobacteriaceae bacterium]
MTTDIRRILRRAVTDMALFSLAISILLLATPLYLLQIYDRVLSASSVDTLAFLSLIVVAALIVNGLLDEVRARYANRLALRLEKAFSGLAFRAALTGPGAAAGDPGPLRDLTMIRGFLNSRVGFSLFDLPFTPIFLFILFLIHPALFYLALGGMALLILIAWLNRMATVEPGRLANEATQAASQISQSFARNQETVKVLGMLDAASRRWGDRFADAALAADRFADINSRWGGVSRTLRQILQSAILGVGAWLVLNREMTAGMIFASSIISGRALTPLDQIINGWRPIVDAQAAWKRLKTSIAQRAASENIESTELPAPTGNVAVENLVYFPPGTESSAQPLIKRLSFAVNAGDTVAVIGPSRAGKSTLMRLIVGAISPRTGTVRLDGADIAAWPSDKLGRHIGYMAQDVELFSGTIAENIARFDPGAKDADVIAAARLSGSHDIIQAQPKGYDTPVGPLGQRLSGGERQRVALARAFYGDPRLIVLDEPNANLDQEGEASLEKSVLEAKPAAPRC